MSNKKIDINYSIGLKQAIDKFLITYKEWIYNCIERYKNETPIDVHDQCTYTVCFKPYIEYTGDTRPLIFMKQRRDAIKDYFYKNDMWQHGYWKIQEAHHGTEHFELFLGALSELDQKDEETINQLVDVAHHMDNSIKNSPEWFDFSTCSFKSMYFGTEQVQCDEGKHINVAEHFRCISICMLAYDLTKEQSYLDFSKLYVDKWVDAILNYDDIPIGFNGIEPIYRLGTDTDTSYKDFQTQANIQDKIGVVENILASAGINLFLKLWQITSEEKYKKAAEKLLDEIISEIADVDADPLFDILRVYRNITEDERYDKVVIETYDKLKDYSFNTLMIEPKVIREKKPQGIGKRSDKPNWYEDNKSAKLNPLFLALVADITGDERIATRAIDIANAYLKLAVLNYDSGRQHGCNSRSVSAIGRGHGRNNNAGVITAVFDPIVKKFM